MTNARQETSQTNHSAEDAKQMRYRSEKCKHFVALFSAVCNRKNATFLEQTVFFLLIFCYKLSFFLFQEKGVSKKHRSKSIDQLNNQVPCNISIFLSIVYPSL